MDSLIRVADSGAGLLPTRRRAVQGAVAGAILYGGFMVEGEIGAILGGGFSLPRLLLGVAFGVAAGFLMGAAYGVVLGRFRQHGFLAHQAAGIVAAAVLITPPVAVGRFLFAPHALAVGVVSVLAVGVSLGVAVWAHGRYSRRAPVAPR